MRTRQPRKEQAMKADIYQRITKEYFDANGRRKIKGSMDIELTVDAMELA
jgi:uncharacterized LabA/DUF88 family protein